MPRHSAHQIRLLVVNVALHSTAPRVTFGRRNVERGICGRPEHRRAAQTAQRRSQRSSARALQHFADRNKTEIAVDHVPTRLRRQRALERVAHDVPVEQIAVIGARIHPGCVRQQHAQGDALLRQAFPLRNPTDKRPVQRKRPVSNRAQRERAGKELRKRRQIEKRVGIDGALKFISSCRSIGSFEDWGAAVFDPRDRPSEDAAARLPEYGVYPFEGASRGQHKRSFRRSTRAWASASRS